MQVRDYSVVVTDRAAEDSGGAVCRIGKFMMLERSSHKTCTWLRLGLIGCLPFVLLLTPLIGAATYYVDFDRGSDSDSGSIAAPWKHCPGDSQATSVPGKVQLAPGDRVLFRGGVAYLGTVYVKWSGASGSPIVYDGGSWGAGRAIIDGEGATLGAKARGYAFNSPAHYVGPGLTRKGNSYITIQNFEIRNLRYMHSDEPGDGPIAVYFDGKGQDATVSNCWIHDVKKRANAIGFEVGTVSVDSLTLTDSQRDFTSMAGTRGQPASHKVQLCWKTDAGRWDDYLHATGFLGELVEANRVKVYRDVNLTVPGWRNAGYDPLRHSTYYYTAFNMIGGSYSNSGGSGIAVKGYDGIRIAANRISECRVAVDISSDPDMPCNGVIVQGNDITAVSWGVSMATASADISSAELTENSFHDFFPYTEYLWGYHNNGMIIYTKGGGSVSGLNISRNKFYGAMAPTNFTGMVYIEGPSDGGPIGPISICNNVFSMRAAGIPYIRLNSGGKRERFFGVDILNNTFAAIPGLGPSSLSATGGPVDLSLRNNIFYLFYQYSACFGVDSSASRGFTSDYNLLHTAIEGGWSPVVYKGKSYTFPEWTATGFDSHSIILRDPLFANAPSFAVKAIPGKGSINRIYYEKPTLSIPTRFVTGDHVEWDFDGTVRTVTAIGDSFFEVDIPLASPPAPLPKLAMPRYQYVVNWKGSTDFAGDYHLLTGSPAIDAGTRLTSVFVATDNDGVTRPQGDGWDIGAYERAAVPASSRQASARSALSMLFVGRGVLTFSIAGPGTARIEIRNLLGQTVRVFTRDVNRDGGLCSVDVRAFNLGAGTYLCRLVANGMKRTVRFAVSE